MQSSYFSQKKLSKTGHKSYTASRFEKHGIEKEKRNRHIQKLIFFF